MMSLKKRKERKAQERAREKLFQSTYGFSSYPPKQMKRTAKFTKTHYYDAFQKKWLKKFDFTDKRGY